MSIRTLFPCSALLIPIQPYTMFPCSEDTCLKEIGLRFQTLFISPHSTGVNMSGKNLCMYVSSYGLTKHVIPMTTAEVGEVRFLVHLVHVFHRRRTYATRVLLCDFDR